MPIDVVAVRTGILMRVERLASKGLPEKDAEEGRLYDLLQDLSQCGAFVAGDHGPFLRDASEAIALRRLGDKLERLRVAVGKDPYAAPREYVAHALWPEVVKAARAALAQMTDGTMEWWRFRDPMGEEGSSARRSEEG